MKALVAIKRVLDYTVKVRIQPDQSDVDLANAKMSMNPFCEIAVEEALRLKERGVLDEVVVVSIGPKACQDQIRSALAMGADSGVWVDAPSDLTALNVAKVLAEVARTQQADLVVMGKQSIDSDNNQTGQMLAAMLDWPQATFASEVQIQEGQLQVTREIDGGLETLGMSLPAVITTDLRLNEPRFIKLPDIMKAKRKPMEASSLEQLGVEPKTRLSTLRVEKPAQRTAGQRVESVDHLIDLLKNEARVL